MICERGERGQHVIFVIDVKQFLIRMLATGYWISFSEVNYVRR